MTNHGVLEQYKNVSHANARKAMLANWVVGIGSIATSMVLHEKGIVNDKQYNCLGWLTLATSVVILSAEMVFVGGSTTCSALKDKITD